MGNTGLPVESSVNTRTLIELWKMKHWKMRLIGSDNIGIQQSDFCFISQHFFIFTLFSFCDSLSFHASSFFFSDLWYVCILYSSHCIMYKTTLHPLPSLDLFSIYLPVQFFVFFSFNLSSGFLTLTHSPNFSPHLFSKSLFLGLIHESLSRMCLN